jgi:hypothetical protein
VGEGLPMMPGAGGMKRAKSNDADKIRRVSPCKVFELKEI